MYGSTQNFFCAIDIFDELIEEEESFKTMSKFKSILLMKESCYNTAFLVMQPIEEPVGKRCVNFKPPNSDKQLEPNQARTNTTTRSNTSPYKK